MQRDSSGLQRSNRLQQWISHFIMKFSECYIDKPIPVQCIYLFRCSQHRNVYYETISIFQCQHCRYFFDINIVDIAPLTILDRYRAYIVYIADICFTLSLAMQCLHHRHHNVLVYDNEPIMSFHCLHCGYFFYVVPCNAMTTM